MPQDIRVGTLDNDASNLRVSSIGGSVSFDDDATDNRVSAIQDGAANLNVSAKSNAANTFRVSGFSNDGATFRVSAVQDGAAALNVSAKSNDAASFRVSGFSDSAATFRVSAFVDSGSVSAKSVDGATFHVSGKSDSAGQLRISAFSDAANLMRVSALHGNSYSNVTTSSPTTIKSGAGYLHALVQNEPTLQNIVKLYDNTTATGTLIASLSAVSGGTFTYNVVFGTGLTVSATSGTPNMTISYI